MRKKIVLISVILILSSVLFSVHAQDNGESDAPYIYYYSPEDQALIIERADGNDKQILSHVKSAEAPHSELGEYMIGPGWSASGEWLAWITSDGLPDESALFLTNREDGEIHSMLEDANGRLVNIAWSGLLQSRQRISCRASSGEAAK